MSEHNDDLKEIRDDIRGLDRWLVRIDEKLNGIARIEKRAEEAYDLADKADDKATEAFNAGLVNARDVQAVETRFKWTVGIVVPFILLILGKLFT